ncbi:MAG: diguanylate cyclase [Sulfuricurvum sp.]|uniref:diguanylate cyclase domain-containing protein n=1 Tax=Sulfuricurvum sp. TaxID=2025608 RepID=UPI00261F4D73|nr:diguanylate cyclase [Sulfuricurvum sp.]MDD5158633.1 diguanylate cyclase [Sulfuricurvum sp.]MDD5160301.1 diguanylate cyclase [Sulfuricurvum sp.]
MISIRKVFFNLKVVLMILGIGVAVLGVQLFHISQYSERLGALKNQHLLIDKIINTDLSDQKMAAILINGAVSEINLSVKLSGQEALLDVFVRSNEEQASLLRSLEISSAAFRDTALIWGESLSTSRASENTRMMNARGAFLADIDRMMDYQIHVINESIATAKMTAIILFFSTLVIFFLYRYRLNQIYRDIDQACSIDTDGSKKEAATQEVDFILKRLLRRSFQNSLNPTLIHPLSGLNNAKGLTALFNAKKAGKGGNMVFLALFEIDQYELIISTFAKEDIENLFKKLGDMISLYEQPLDVIAHMEDDRIAFLLSRNSKQLALQECETIVQSVQESSFNAELGPIKITLSAGFLLKPPSKSIDETVEDAAKLIEKAKENGGNRVAQIR